MSQTYIIERNGRFAKILTARFEVWVNDIESAQQFALYQNALDAITFAEIRAKIRLLPRFANHDSGAQVDPLHDSGAIQGQLPCGTQSERPNSQVEDLFGKTNIPECKTLVPIPAPIEPRWLDGVAASMQSFEIFAPLCDYLSDPGEIPEEFI
jgi:hypothetical protein